MTHRHAVLRSLSFKFWRQFLTATALISHYNYPECCPQHFFASAFSSDSAKYRCCAKQLLNRYRSKFSSGKQYARSPEIKDTTNYAVYIILYRKKRIIRMVAFIQMYSHFAPPTTECRKNAATACSCGQLFCFLGT